MRIVFIKIHLLVVTVTRNSMEGFGERKGKWEVMQLHYNFKKIREIFFMINTFNWQNKKKLHCLPLSFLLQMHGQKQLKKGLFILTHISRVYHGSGGQMAGTGGMWLHHVHSQEAEKDGHLCLLAFFFMSGLGPRPMGWCYPHLRYVFSPQLSQSKNSFTHMLRSLFPMWF